MLRAGLRISRGRGRPVAAGLRRPEVFRAMCAPTAGVHTSGTWKHALLCGTIVSVGVFGVAEGNENGLVGIIPRFAEVQDSLRQVGYEGADKFPQIVCIGVQSSGKSSVMESIVGESFLPKGEGLVTKRPLVLTLHRMEGESLTWAEFPDLKSGPISDFSKVEQIIRKQSKRISKEPLRLHVYSPNVVDLRLVDLPGFIQNPKRDQAMNTPEVIKSMVTSYIKQENTVILAVSGANSDLQTSETLRFARGFDPKGERTICVLTKMDLIDDVEFKELQRTIRSLPLRMGYVGVKCRSKAETTQGLSVLDARKVEREFFEQHQIARTRAGLTFGVTGLATCLTGMLEKQVLNALRPILANLRTDLMGLESRKRQLGRNIADPEAVLLAELSDFRQAWLGPKTLDEVKKCLARYIYDRVADRLHMAGAELVKQRKLEKAFEPMPGQAPSFWEGEEGLAYARWRGDVVKAIHDALMQQEAELTYHAVELLKAHIPGALEVLSNRPALKHRVEGLCHEFLKETYEDTAEHINYLMSLEVNVSYDNRSMEERYLKLLEAEPSIDDGNRSVSFWSFGAQQNQSRPVIRKYGFGWTKAYFQHVSERLSINIFNALCVEVINPLPENIGNMFIKQLYEDASILVKESPDVAEEREVLERQIAQVNRAISELKRMQRKLA